MRSSAPPSNSRTWRSCSPTRRSSWPGPFLRAAASFATPISWRSSCSAPRNIAWRSRCARRTAHPLPRPWCKRACRAARRTSSRRSSAAAIPCSPGGRWNCSLPRTSGTESSSSRFSRPTIFRCRWRSRCTGGCRPRYGRTSCAISCSSRQCWIPCSNARFGGPWSIMTRRSPRPHGLCGWRAASTSSESLPTVFSCAHSARGGCVSAPPGYPCARGPISRRRGGS